MPRTSQPDKIRQFRRLVTLYARRSLRSFPWRKTTSPYPVLLAEMMLQRTGAPQVRPVYQQFLQRFPTVRRVAEARPNSLYRSLRPLGRTNRYRVLARAFQQLHSEHGGRVPDRLEELLDVPGVGPYTGRAVLCFAFGRRLGLLDPGIYRLLKRVFRIRAAKKRYHTDRGLWYFVDQLVPRTRVREFNWALLDLASDVCVRRNPKCHVCPLRTICSFALAASHARR